MSRRLARLLLLASLSFASAGQAYAAKSSGYTSYIDGNAANVVPALGVTPGLVLMGGGTDVDAAFQWMCSHGGNGDFVIIRTTGTDAYNPYIRSLCHDIDSIETLVITTTAGANAPYVRDAILGADALFIAGGDQSTYTSLWRGTEVQKAVNYLLNTKHAPVGGTSAGLAVLSRFIYTGALGSVTSKQALDNPYHRYITLERDLFASDWGANTLYDSHFVTRDRMGRLTVFLARLMGDNFTTTPPRGIGIDEATALLVNANGTASLVGSGAAYFLQAPGPAQLLAAKVPLTYAPIATYRIRAGGAFNFSTWTGSGGTAYTLTVTSGVVTSTQAGGSIY